VPVRWDSVRSLDDADLCNKALDRDECCFGFPILCDSWFLHVVNSYNVVRYLEAFQENEREKIENA
jgi:hypothetical protein